MPNHFHVVVREKQEEGISLYMRKLLTGYSMYFNKKYKRTGTLFEGTFKSTHCNEDRYLKYLYSYIHLNPAKLIDKNWRENKKRDTKLIWDFISKYKYSSFNENSLSKFPILNFKTFPKYFDNKQSKISEIFEWLEFSP